MQEFDKIHLCWRHGQGGRRHGVGVLQKMPDDTFAFKYSEEAKTISEFTPYPEFQNFDQEYKANVVEIFGQRLTKIDRPDIHTFFEFWEVDAAQAFDKFYLLGKTQGLVATDNFEFLAEYKLSKNTHFLTEVASLSLQPLPRGTVEIGDSLRFELEPKNEYDPFAVRVFKGDLQIGYIKKYHNKIFHEQGAEKLKLIVKALEKNGVIKRIFIKVCF